MLPDITQRLLAGRSLGNFNTGISKYGSSPGFDPATLGDQPVPGPNPTPIPASGDVNPAYIPPVQVQPPQVPFATNPIQRPLPTPAANPRSFGGPSGDWMQNAQGNALPGHWLAPSVPTPPGALGVQGQGGSFFTQSGSPAFDVPGGIPFDQGQGQNAFNQQYMGRYHPITDFGAWRNPMVEWGGMTPQEFHDWSHSPQLSVAAMQALMANRPPVPVQREDQLPGLGIRHQGLSPRPI